MRSRQSVRTGPARGLSLRIATPWSASFDYDGRFYITSEHNGAPGFDIGDVRQQTVREMVDWFGGKTR